MSFSKLPQIKTPHGLKWLTVPVEVSGKYFQKISDTKIANKDWAKDHWSLIRQNYKNASHFREMAGWIEPLYLNCNYCYLTDVNLHFIRAINDFLNIKTRIVQSSEFKLHEEKTQRLVNICIDLKATDYYSGPAAKAYMDEQKFVDRGIRINYWDYSGYKQYDQLFPPFEHGVSILDLIFNVGNDTKSFLKS